MPPSPSPFPVSNAAETVRHLAGTIGLRIPGQPGFQAALDWLRSQMEALPGWEIQVQEAAAGRDWAKTLVGTRHFNLVARLRGTEPGAILVNSHLDSPPSSVGAADDGAAVAVMLEAARLLSAGPRPRRSLIFLFNGSEETGLQGALSFVEQHPWAGEVAAFINLEAAGCDGPFTLFQSSSRLPELLRAYRGVARPIGSVVAQDLFESRIFKNDTDYRVFAAHGLHGVDLALTGDGYAYHTWRDQPERLTERALEEMGETLLSLLEGLEREPSLTPREKPAPRVYFDLLGQWFVDYPRKLAPWLLGAAALVGAVAAWGLPWWWGFLQHMGALLAALLLPAGAAWVMGRLTRYDLWWFAHPGVTGAAWVALALAGLTAVKGLFPLPPGTDWAGTVLFWLLLAAAGVFKGVGSAFLPTAWALSGALGMLLQPVSPVAAVLVAVGGVALMGYSTVAGLLRFVLPHLGRNPFPSHMVVAALLGFLTLTAAAYLPLPLLAAPWWALMGVMLLGVAALLPAVSFERPEFVSLYDLWVDGSGYRVVSPLSRQFSPAVRRQVGGGGAECLAEPLRKGHLLLTKAAVARAHDPAAGLESVEPPRLELVSDASGESRQITVRCVSGGYAVVLSCDVEAQELAVDAGSGQPVMRAKKNRLRFVNPPPEGLLVTFTVAPGAACRIVASAWYLQESRPEFGAGTNVLYQKAAVAEISCQP